MRRGLLREVSVAVRTRPDERVAFLAFDLDQRGVDRSREARVIQLDRDVVAALLLGLLLPAGAELGVMRSGALCGVVLSECRFSAGFGLAALHIISWEEPRRLGGRTVAAAVGQRDQTRV